MSRCCSVKLLTALMSMATFILSLSVTATEKDQAERRFRQEFIERRIAVEFWSTPKPTEVKAIQALGFSIERREGKRILVRGNRTVKEHDLKSLRKVRGVRDVRRDRFVPINRTASHSSSTDCVPPNISGPISAVAQDFNGLISAMSPPNSARKCNLFETCKGTNEPKLWANEMLDTELMLDEMMRMGIPAGNVKAAVLDSGFDLSIRSQIRSSNFKVLQTFPHTTPSGKDFVGHGTAVTGLFGAAGGIGLAPNAALSVYSITPPTVNGASEQDMVSAIRKACEDGNEVINLSLGNAVDEATSNRASFADRELFADLEKKGCLVVKAGGNDGHRDRFGSDGSIPSLLTVEAISKTGIPAVFSSSGELPAPGENVFTLASTQETDIPKSIVRCDGGQFTSGTSFASPIVAAVASNVVSVLKTDPKYSTLDGPKKLALIRHILHESVTGVSVNGFKAVLLAEAWTKNSTKNQDPAQVKWSQVNHPILKSCNSESSSCEVLSPCSEKQRECLFEKKKKFVLCPSPRNKDVADFLSTIQSAGYPDIASIWMQRLSKTPGIVFPESMTTALRNKLLDGMKNPSKPILEKIEDYGSFVRMTGTRLPEIENEIDAQSIQFLEKSFDDSFLSIGQARNNKQILTSLFLSGIWNTERVATLVREFGTGKSHIAPWYLLEGMNADNQSAKARVSVLDATVSSAADTQIATKVRLIGVADYFGKSNVDIPEGTAILRKLIQKPAADDYVLGRTLDVVRSNVHDFGRVQDLLFEAIQSPKAGENTFANASKFLLDPRLNDAEAMQLAKALMKKSVAQAYLLFELKNSLGQISLDQTAISNAARPMPKRSQKMYQDLLTEAIHLKKVPDAKEGNPEENSPAENLLIALTVSPLPLASKISLLREYFGEWEKPDFDSVLFALPSDTGMSVSDAKALLEEYKKCPKLTADERALIAEQGSNWLSKIERETGADE